MSADGEVLNSAVPVGRCHVTDVDSSSELKMIKTQGRPHRQQAGHAVCLESHWENGEMKGAVLACMVPNRGPWRT